MWLKSRDGKVSIYDGIELFTITPLVHIAESLSVVVDFLDVDILSS